MPAVLSSCNVFWQIGTSTGIIIPVHKFEEYDPKNNDTLSAYLSRPTLNFATMDDLIKRWPSLLKKKAILYKARTTYNVKPTKAVAYWERPDVRAHYGPYTFTYGLMSARYLAATNASRAKSQAKQKAKKAQEDEETKENRRLTIDPDPASATS